MYIIPFAIPAGAVPIRLAGGVALRVQQTEVWQGQFPPPDAIERYEKVSSGSFDRLITMAEKQQDASIEGNREARRNLRADTQRGHYLGALIAVLAIAGAVYCAVIGQPWVAAALVGVPVLAVARALVESSRAKPLAIQAKVAAEEISPTPQPPEAPLAGEPNT